MRLYVRMLLIQKASHLIGLSVVIVFAFSMAWLEQTMNGCACTDRGWVLSTSVGPNGFLLSLCARCAGWCECSLLLCRLWSVLECLCVYLCIITFIWLKNDPALPDSLIVASIRKSQELLIEIDCSFESTYIKGYAYTKAVTSKWTFIICNINMHTVFSVSFL